MPNSNPRIGDKLPFYPFGYGWCQCGCNKLTQLNMTEANPDGIWAMYIEGHEPIHETENSSEESAPKQLGLRPVKCPADQNDPKSIGPHDPVYRAVGKKYVATEKGLLDLFCDLVFKYNLLQLEVKFIREKIWIATKLINDFWKDKHGAKELVMEKLKEALTSLESHNTMPRGRKQ
jgi:hypothetical protein